MRIQILYPLFFAHFIYSLLILLFILPDALPRLNQVGDTTFTPSKSPILLVSGFLECTCSQASVTFPSSGFQIGDVLSSLASLEIVFFLYNMICLHISYKPFFCYNAYPITHFFKDSDLFP